MKYVLYIDYSASYKPMTSEYRKLEAKTLSDAMLEADNQYNPDTMYLIRIMVKDGKTEKVESDLVNLHKISRAFLCNIFYSRTIDFCRRWCIMRP